MIAAAAFLLGSLSARALAAPACPSYGALPDAPADYAQAVERFAQYRAAKQVGIRDESNLPFLRTHGAAAADAVLLVHGLSDSPYYVSTLADAFYDRGFNVVSVLLPGHGTAPECLLHVKKKEWRREVQFGLSLARRLGARVSMAGFSTGGTLSLDAVARNFERSNNDPIPWGDLYLFSPALGFDILKIDVCDVPGAAGLAEKILPWKDGNPDAPETDPHKYEKMATNAVCQLLYLTQDNELHSAVIGQDIADHGIGVFAVESMADTTVSPEAVVMFMNGLPSGARKETILYPKGEKIAHADVPRPETNPHYADMISALDRFISVRTPSSPSSAELLRRADDLARALAP